MGKVCRDYWQRTSASASAERCIVWRERTWRSSRRGPGEQFSRELLAGAASTADRSDEAGVQILNMLMMYRMKQIVKTVNPAMI